jgi:hypothetical protein
MRRSLSLVFALLLITSALSAQSRLARIAMSAVLPGSGEISLGKTNRGVALLASEIIAAYGFFKTDYDMGLQRDAYKKYALEYAGVPLDMPQSHYQAIQEDISSNEYNLYLEMIARNYYLITNYDPAAYNEFMETESYSGDQEWQWQSPMHWDKYKDMRRKHQRTKINHNLALGVMLLNRAISVVDTALLSRNMQVYASTNGVDSLLLNYSVRF